MTIRRFPFGRAAAGVHTTTPSDREEVGAPAKPARRRFRGRLLRWTLLTSVAVAVLGAALFPVRHHFSAQAADLSRQVVGDEHTARIEGWYFRFEDRTNRLRYRLLGTDASPFSDTGPRARFIPAPPSGVVLIWRGDPGLASPRPIIPEVVRSEPMPSPATRALRNNPEPGEGAWTTLGLPRSSAADPLMMKTFFRPDASRPYAQVGVLAIDGRRVRLHITGGTGEPGGSRGVRGPGTVPAAAHPSLLAAWTGGFKGPHGNYGMYADGQTYVPLRNGLASIVVYRDGRMRLGQWGRDITWTDDIEAVRQNAVLLVDGGQVSSRVREGNDTWGYVQVNSAEFITWRSAVGMTADGHLLVAAGNSLSAETLARALWAAGAHWAMQLDINSPYVLTGLYTQETDGSVRADRFMPAMPDNPRRFLSPHERDLMYVTLDESRFYQLATPPRGVVD